MSARVLVGKAFLFVLLVAVALVVPACNTVSGMGRDLSSAGNSMECCAEKSK